jgi:hypothetical protein
MGIVSEKPWTVVFVEVVLYCKSFGLKMYVIKLEGPTYWDLNSLLVKLTAGLAANAWEQLMFFPLAVRMMQPSWFSSSVGWTKFELSRRKANAGRSASPARSIEDSHLGLLYCGIALA